MKKTLNLYSPGIILFIFSLVICMFTYKDYGVGWDEPAQRDIGLMNYAYVFSGDTTLKHHHDRDHGAGFELPLISMEHRLHLSDPRDIYLARHLATHLFFLISALFGYVLVYRLFKDQFLACIGFIMLAFMPRIYAHSFFNSKDVPFLSMLLISLAVAQIAFEKRKLLPFFFLGLACGYTNSIRIMGIVPVLMIICFLFFDIIASIIKKENAVKPVGFLLVFLLGFCGLIYMAWPTLWGDPFHNFIQVFKSLSHYHWDWWVLFRGERVRSTALPWTYFPVWFSISTPMLWLFAGIVGIVWFAFSFVRGPLTFFRNTVERNFLLYIVCFFAPVLAVILLHSVIYDDWRHLYFVYPPFVLLALFALHQLSIRGWGWVVRALCLVQVTTIGFFMVKYHPHQQVYFNYLVSHQKEYLRKNYELDYWGAATKQGLDYILAHDTSSTIRVHDMYHILLDNNVAFLPAASRKRFVVTPTDDADYLITNFRDHTDDYKAPVFYKIMVEHSRLCVFTKDSQTPKGASTQ